jgi:hypothetical protein
MREIERKVEDLAKWFLEHKNDAKDADKCMQFLKRAMSCQIEINIIMAKEMQMLDSRTNNFAAGLVERLKSDAKAETEGAL